MDRAVVPHTPSAATNFRDGLGERRRQNDAGGDSIELLCLRRELTAVPSFEFALRERASRLAGFRHEAFARVRNIDRLNEPSAALAVVSTATRGVRLSQLLIPNGRRPVSIDISAALHLIRQLVSAVAALHESARDIAHGALAPERIIVTANARAVIAEYVLGAALEQLRYTPERYWRELRIALPDGSAAVKFDHRADVTQLGMIALSLVLRRPLSDEEHPAAAGSLLDSARAVSSRGSVEPLPQGLREWIARALQVDSRDAFKSAAEARTALERVAAGLTGTDGGGRGTRTEPKTTGRTGNEAPAPATILPPAKAPRVTIVQPPTVAAVTPQPAANGETRSRAVSPLPLPPPLPAAPRVAISGPPAETTAAAGASRISAAAGAEPFVHASATTANATAEPALTVAIAQSGMPPLPSFEPLTGELEPARPFELDAQSYESTAELTEETHTEKKTRKPLAVAGVLVAVVAAAGVYGARQLFSTPASPVTTGTLNIGSSPAGAQVFVDRQGRGTTPLTLSLRPGPHSVELRGIGEPRTVDVTITAGAETSQFIELGKSAPVVLGQLQVRTEPAGAALTVDGVPRGKTPILVESLMPGAHVVLLESDLGAVRQTVKVEPAATASLVVPMAVPPPAAPLSGWITLRAPVDLEIREHGKVLGTSQSERIMVTAGRHELEIVSDTLAYRATAIVQVAPGKVAPVKIEWPKGTASLNAEPWAEVWIDGEKVGDTPIGNLSLPIGPHEVVFRHPELGERRHAVSVSLRAPARLSVDMRKP